MDPGRSLDRSVLGKNRSSRPCQGCPEKGEFKEIVIPVVGTKGQKAALTGRIRTKLSPADQEEIAKLLAESLVADLLKKHGSMEDVRRRLRLRRPSVRKDGGAAKEASYY